ncbi:MAG: single-stranded DNA-binding protein [Candidatus Colwellbacteria bacterium]|nr:single-stranded DNA-binding protein [Candidatus Colwellbacteria bacterium]
MNLNKVLILGRLTADPQLRTTPSGDQVATFSVATNRNWTDRSGGKKESTEFHNVVVWGRQAEIANQFLKKGGLVLIEGRLQTRSWEGKDGQMRKTTEIIGERIQLGPRKQGEASGGEPPEKEAAEMPTIDLEEGDIKPEDLPF